MRRFYWRAPAGHSLHGRDWPDREFTVLGEEACERIARVAGVWVEVVDEPDEPVGLDGSDDLESDPVIGEVDPDPVMPVPAVMRVALSRPRGRPTKRR